MAANSIRFTGLASGLDTESMVKAMTMREQAKVDSSKQNKLLMEMRKEAYKDVSKAISDFHTKFASNVRLENSFNKVKTTNSNPTLVTINSGTKSGTHTISEISQLASVASITTSSTGKTSDTKLEDVITFPTDGTDIILKVKDGDTEKKLVLTKDMTLNDLSVRLGKAMPNSNVTYDDTTKSFFISSRKTGESQKLEMSVVNGNIDVDTGEITNESDNNDVLDKFGLGSGNSVTATGGNAVFKYNGLEVISETNTVNVNGISITINGTTVINGIDNGEKATINTEQDTDAMFNHVKEFVDEYNKLVNKLNGLVDAKPNKDYKPLTDEQKKEMSEEDIKLWNQKINDSLLSKDPTVKGILGDMREIMSSIVPEVGMLSDIGIGSVSWQDKGVITINEEKLRKALDTDPDKVMKLFAGEPGGKGIADKLYESLDTHFKGISGVKTSLSVFNDTKLDNDITKEIENARKLQERLDRIQDMHYKKFTAMEKMLSSLNSQSSWLAGQMGS